MLTAVAYMDTFMYFDENFPIIIYTTLKLSYCWRVLFGSN